MYNFFEMFFFGEKLKTRHKVTLCLAALGILLNFWICTKLPGTFPFIEFLEDGRTRYHWTNLVLSYGILVKILMIVFFRKF